MTIHIAVLGLASFYGPAYTQRALDHPDTEVVAAVALADDEALGTLGQPTRDAFREEYSCPVFESVDELLVETAIDAAVVATPTDRRANDAVTILDAGYPVLSAKPAAGSEVGARRIAEAAKAADTPALTTSPARFDDPISALSSRVHNGELGEVCAVRAAIRHDRVPADGIEANAEHAPHQAGGLYAMGYYTADLLCWFVDANPERTFAEFDNVNTSHSTHPDLGAATVRFADGVLGTMTVTYSTDCRERLGNWEVEVVGTDGIGRTSHTGYEGMIWHGSKQGRRSAEVFERTRTPILDRQFAAFVDAIQSGGYPDIVPEPEMVADALALCERWEESARTGEPAVWKRG